MDDMVYDSLSTYYHALEKKGYMPYPQMVKLLILCFYNEFVYNDYRGLISKEDYRIIERALDCLYGTTCLIPYPDYLKMGKMYIGETSELAQKVKALEETNVLKLIHNPEEAEGEMESDVMVMWEDEDE